jgi:hypothetical protein
MEMKMKKLLFVTTILVGLMSNFQAFASAVVIDLPAQPCGTGSGVAANCLASLNNEPSLLNSAGAVIQYITVSDTYGRVVAVINGQTFDSGITSSRNLLPSFKNVTLIGPNGQKALISMSFSDYITKTVSGRGTSYIYHYAIQNGEIVLN